MGIMIDDPRAQELASELGALTGESLVGAVLKSLVLFKGDDFRLTDNVAVV